MTTARIETEHGTMELVLFTEDAPRTVRNFVDLAARGYYDDLVFHRVVSDFMVQGGCPEGTGRGGPGYNVPDEPNEQRHLTGTLSMANKGTPNSGGSQFFICHRPLPHLDGKHTVFGRITKGIDVLYKVRAGDKIVKIATS